MGISTKVVKKAFISKELKPGNIVAKINKLELKKSDNPREEGKDEWTLMLHLEGKPMGKDFVGFDKVFGDPSKGQYLGQTVRVKATRYPIRTFSWTSKKDGSEQTKTDVEQILGFIQQLCDVVGKDWLDEIDGKFETLEEIASAFNRQKVVKDVYMSWLVGAEQKVNSKGYDVYYCFLPDYRTAKTVVAKEGGLVTEFDQAVHIIADKKSSEESESLIDGTDDEDLTDELLDDSDEELFDIDGDDEEAF